MKIGIDLSVLQTPHRMRGIGSTLINFINYLPDGVKKANSFVFYLYSHTEAADNPLQLLKLDGITYITYEIKPIKKSSIKLPGKLQLIISAVNQLRVLRDIYMGDSRIKNLDDVDHFLQFDQNQPLPSKRKVTSSMIVYDLIPYVMEADYLWSYSTARLHGRTRKGSLRFEFRRRRYLAKTRLITRQASQLLAISKHTKQDFIKYLRIQPDKIKVCLLGVSDEYDGDRSHTVDFKQYVHTSWGPIASNIDLSKEKFILFIGGADERRKLVDLIAAFNNLRAQGRDIKLVLAGDTMYGASQIPNPIIQSYFKNSSYMDDVIFLGFINNEQRDWLYRHAIAFVYPSVYEGFGLPVLEAMLHACPVICYKNSSITEVAGSAALFAKDYYDIFRAIRELLDNPSIAKKYIDEGTKQAAKFNWSTTATEIIDSIC